MFVVKMCGISGIVAKQGAVQIEQLVRMNRAIAHRGPDDEGFVFFHENETSAYISSDSCATLTGAMPTIEDNLNQEYVGGIAHRRLSIIDLSANGHQPMQNASKQLHLSFNGEIYNYKELRSQLKSAGYNFTTDTDTEVVLHAYDYFGKSCVEHFNGMFSFILVDLKQHIWFCARDRAGVKPFYYANTNEFFAVCSEYKGFIRSGLIAFSPNPIAEVDFIINGNIEEENQGLFKGIVELQPGNTLTYDLKKHKVQLNSFREDTSSDLQLSDEAYIARIREALIESVSLRLQSDVAVGACLSGGLDSSILAGIMKEVHPEIPRKLFTVSYPNEAFDETPYAKEVAAFTGYEWHCITPTKEGFIQELTALNYFQDVPIWSSSTYSQYKVMELAAKNGVKVVLDGQGADELFAGYMHHYLAFWRSLPLTKRLQEMANAKESVQHPLRTYWKQLIKQNLQLNKNRSGVIHNDLKQSIRYDTIFVFDDLNQQLDQDYKKKLKSFLKCEDRCSMAFSLESRVPFADDIPLINLMSSIPGQRKIQNGVSKYLLREAAKPFLPESIYKRKDKVGFESPLKKWLVPHSEAIREQLLTGDTCFDRAFIEQNFQKLVEKDPNLVFRLLSLANWKNTFASL